MKEEQIVISLSDLKNPETLAALLKSVEDSEKKVVDIENVKSRLSSILLNSFSYHLNDAEFINESYKKCGSDESVAAHILYRTVCDARQTQSFLHGLLYVIQAEQKKNPLFLPNVKARVESDWV